MFMPQVELLDTSKLHPSFLNYQVECIASDVKESLCRTSDNLFVPQQHINMPTIPYEVSGHP
jgi:actin-like protein 6A